MSKYEIRIERAASIAYDFGVFDGEHHKQWVIDQMLRAMLGDAGYCDFVHRSSMKGHDWDQGVPRII